MAKTLSTTQKCNRAKTGSVLLIHGGDCQLSYLVLGERVSGKGADLYEMCDELDAILRGG